MASESLSATPSSFSGADRVALLGLARRALERHVLGTPEPVEEATGLLAQDRATFVTLRIDGALRGCMGSLVAKQPLSDEVQRTAVLAAERDPRFPPVSPSELDRVTIEVTVLGPLEPVADTSDIVVGVHGLLLVSGNRRGTLLPQVASDRGWSRDEFLIQLCRKAGLPGDCWSKAELYRFTAISFSE